MQNPQSQTFYEQVSRNNRRSNILGMTGFLVLVLMLTLLCSSFV